MTHSALLVLANVQNRKMYLYTPTVRELFFAFMKIGVSAFGGALPWARHFLVEKNKWVSEAQFTDILTISQTVPGPNIINVAVYYGYKCRGVVGGLAACIGLLILPFFITVSLSIAVGSALSSAQAKSALMGLTAAAVGFMLATSIKLMRPFSKNALALGVCALTVVLGIVFKLPLPIILLIAGALSIALAIKSKV
jgi:chromate transporter